MEKWGGFGVYKDRKSPSDMFSKEIPGVWWQWGSINCSKVAVYAVLEARRAFK